MRVAIETLISLVLGLIISVFLIWLIELINN